MTPLQLRTVRPFVLESLVLQEVSDEEDLDLTDKTAITVFLRSRVSTSLQYHRRTLTLSCLQVEALIEKANAQWEERNARGVEQGLEELPAMLPLIRLKASRDKIPWDHKGD